VAQYRRIKAHDAEFGDNAVVFSIGAIVIAALMDRICNRPRSFAT